MEHLLICCEFLRVSMHPRAFKSPLAPGKAWQFLNELLDSPGFSLLRPTESHRAVLAQSLAELPEIRGNILHYLHTAVLMR